MLEETEISAKEALAEVALDLAKSELEGQAVVLAQARTRAAAYITASFGMAVFAAPIVLDGELRKATSILCGLQAIGFFTAVGAAIAVVSPSRSRKDKDEGARRGPFRFALGAAAVLDKSAVDATDARAQVARDLESLYDNNQPVIQNVLKALHIAGLAVIIQMIFWGAMFLIEKVFT